MIQFDENEFENDQLKNSQKAYNIPENYFEDLTNNILNKTTNDPEVKTKTLIKRKWLFAIAASSIPLLVGGLLYFQGINNNIDLDISQLSQDININLYEENTYEEELWIYASTHKINNLDDHSSLINHIDNEEMDEDLLNEFELYE